MRYAPRLSMRRWLFLPVVVLILSGFAAGCSSSSSSKPAYCTSASQLKTSVQNLDNVDVAKNGISSLQTALSSVKTNATTLASDAQSAFGPQVTALQTSISSLDTAVNSAKGQPALTAAKTIAAPLMQVKSSASNLVNATSGKCQ
jgi:hypothetical protein